MKHLGIDPVESLTRVEDQVVRAPLQAHAALAALAGLHGDPGIAEPHPFPLEPVTMSLQVGEDTSRLTTRERRLWAIDANRVVGRQRVDGGRDGHVLAQLPVVRGQISGADRPARQVSITVGQDRRAPRCCSIPPPQTRASTTSPG